MKRKKEDLSEGEYVEAVDLLYTAAGSLKGRDAMKMFLKDLLTPSERLMLGRRIQIAQYILQGESPTEIGRKMKVGRNTVWRVEKWLDDQLPGYENAIAGAHKEVSARKSIVDTDAFSWEALRKKYPYHFIFSMKLFSKEGINTNKNK